MKLRRVAIRSFRKLARPILIDPLGDGLTILAGDNEEGKSTVLAALKAALFEHHTVGGSVREAMEPHGGGVPEIEIAFELAGRRYGLSKQFRRGGVTLETPAGLLENDAAERRLQELLGFDRRQGRSALLPRHQGLQGLFWVDQGTTFRGLDEVEVGRERIIAAIEAEVGTVAGGEEARRLLDRIAAQCRRFWTGQRWSETGELLEARKAVTALEERAAALRERARAYDEKVDRLERLRADRRRFIEGDRLGHARERVGERRRRLAEVEQLEGRHALVAERRKVAEAEQSRLAGLDATRRNLREQAGKLAEQHAAAEARLAALQADLAAAEQALVAATEREAQTQTRSAAAKAALERLDRWIEAQAKRRELAGLRASLQRAAEAEEAGRRAQAELAANVATPARLEKARAALARRQEAAARLDAAATRLEFAPETAAGVRVAGREHDPARPLQLTERTELELGGFGRLTVVPGGTDIVERRQALAEAQAALDAALAAAGAAGIEAAERLAERRVELAAAKRDAATRLQATLAAVEAEGLDELRDRLAGLEASLERLADAAAPEDGEPEDVGERRRASSAELATCDGAWQEAAQATRAAERLCGERRQQAAVAAAGLEDLARQRQALDRRLEEETDRLADAMLAEALAQAAAAAAEAMRGFELIDAELRRADPEAAREQLRIAERAVQELEAEGRRLEASVRELEVELRTLGEGNIGEELAEVEERLVLARNVLARVEREARAWRLLHDELKASETATREALAGPVRERLAPYLVRLFPEAEPVLDPEDFRLAKLQRRGVAEGFDTLSVGTREQLAVLVRLAFARLLLEREGEAPCLILDDALVYADEGRFEVMKAILQRAASDLQIIVLTCRPRDYLGLDAAYLRLEDCLA